MVCVEKSKLLEAYRQATESSAAVVAELHQHMGTLSKKDYDALYRSTESLQADVTRTQGELNGHVVSHGC